MGARRPPRRGRPVHPLKHYRFLGHLYQDRMGSHVYTPWEWQARAKGLLQESDSYSQLLAEAPATLRLPVGARFDLGRTRSPLYPDAGQWFDAREALGKGHELWECL